MTSVRRLSFLFCCVATSFSATHAFTTSKTIGASLLTLCVLQGQNYLANGDAFVKVLKGNGDRVGKGFAEIFDTTCTLTGMQDEDILTVRYNISGAPLWERVYTANVSGMVHEVNGVASTSDLCYLLAGTTQEGNVTHGLVLKYNSYGDLVWARNIGDDNMVAMNHVAITSEGGFVTIGTADWSPGGGGTEAVLTKLNLLGEVEWVTSFGGQRNDTGNHVLLTSDGDYIFTGSIGIDTQGMYLAKLNSTREIDWAVALLTDGRAAINGTAPWIAPRAILNLKNETYVVAATLYNKTSDLLIATFDTKSGGTVDIQLFGGEYDDEVYSISRFSDDSYVVAGSYGYEDGSHDLLMIKFDEEGKKLWSRKFAYGEFTVGYNVMVNDRDEIVITGRTQAGATEDSEMFFGKWPSNGKGCGNRFRLREKDHDLRFGFLFNASVGEPSYDSWEIYFDLYELEIEEEYICDSALLPRTSPISMLLTLLTALCLTGIPYIHT